jgi:predicted nucleic acid-binding protein
MVIIDTSVIIDHLRSNGAKETYLMKLAKKYNKNELSLSLITVQELYEGKSSNDKEKELYMLATISALNILPYDYQISKRAGELARGLVLPIEFADAAIAATALEHNSYLATLNQKVFAQIKDLQMVRFE